MSSGSTKRFYSIINQNSLEPETMRLSPFFRLGLCTYKTHSIMPDLTKRRMMVGGQKPPTL